MLLPRPLGPTRIPTIVEIVAGMGGNRTHQAPYDATSVLKTERDTSPDSLPTYYGCNIVSVTLRVPFDGFAEAIKRFGGGTVAYVEAQGTQTVLTASMAGSCIVSVAHLSVDRTMEKLQQQGIQCAPGRWIVDGSEEFGVAAPFVAAVAYKTDEDRPGLWVDAYEQAPNDMDVLRAMYEEFTATGQVGEMDFESFLNEVKATVVVVSPEQLAQYAEEKATPPA